VSVASIHPSDARDLKLLLYFLRTLDPPVRTCKSTMNFSQYSSCRTTKCAAYKIKCFEIAITFLKNCGLPRKDLENCL